MIQGIQLLFDKKDFQGRQKVPGEYITRLMNLHFFQCGVVKPNLDHDSFIRDLLIFYPYINPHYALLKMCLTVKSVAII
jgi:hypothetical protein